MRPRCAQRHTDLKIKILHQVAHARPDATATVAICAWKRSNVAGTDDGEASAFSVWADSTDWGSRSGVGLIH